MHYLSFDEFYCKFGAIRSQVRYMLENDGYKMEAM